MSQSLSAIYIHAIFRTKNSALLIDQNIEEKLHSYIGGMLKNRDSPAIKINSMPNHIHILFRLSKNYSISQIMHIIKKDSSKWMKTDGYNGFKWQTGYGAFSVSQSKVKIVSDYIVNQKEHHKKVSLFKEVEIFMNENNVDQYSRDYFWS